MVGALVVVEPRVLVEVPVVDVDVHHVYSHQHFLQVALYPIDLEDISS